VVALSVSVDGGIRLCRLVGRNIVEWCNVVVSLVVYVIRSGEVRGLCWYRVSRFCVGVVFVVLLVVVLVLVLVVVGAVLVVVLEVMAAVLVVVGGRGL
jgi:hypothetical protein